MTRYFMPVIMGSLALGQAIYCGCDGDWRRAGYWLSCVAITFFVTI